MPDEQHEQRLLLFSSNIRPQYEQDIIDVTAAAPGSHFRFRYEEKYVAPDLRADWREHKLAGTKCVVIYSIQQPADFHPAAYVPIRSAEVVRTFEEGSMLVVEFRIGMYAPLRSPNEGESVGGLVQDFTNSVAETATAGHPGAGDAGTRYSAALASPAGLTTGKTEAHGFERIVRYLSGTVSFAGRVFWRVGRIREVGSKDDLSPDIDGRFHLTSGVTYEATILHYQLAIPADAGTSPATFDLSTDTALVDVIGPKSFKILSRYDAVPVRLRVALLGESKETYLSIRPSAGTNGPNADIHLLVGPTSKQRVTTAGLGAGAALALAVAALMSDKLSVLDRSIPTVFAVVLTGLLGFHAVPLRGK